MDLWFEIRRRFRCAQHIGHQRAATGAKLCQDAVAPALIHPCLHQAKAQQLAKHLADLGRSGEIALRPERVVRRVIAVLWVQQAGLHIVGKGHGALRRDLGAQQVFQRHVARRRATTMISTPTMIIGLESSCPMVSPSGPICNA